MDLPDYLVFIENATRKIVFAQAEQSPELMNQNLNDAKNILLQLSLKISNHIEYYRMLNEMRVKEILEPKRISRL